MRALVALLMLSLSLSGCVGGNDTGGEPFVPSCPSWTAFSTTDEEGNSIRPAAHRATTRHYWNNTSGPDGGGSWPDEHKESPPIVPGSPGGIYLRDEHPVDFYDLRFDHAYTLDVDATLRVRGADSGRNLVFRDMETDQYTSILRFPDGTNETDPNAFPTYRIELANPEADPAPEGLVLVWDYVPDKDDDRQTHSFFLTEYEVYAWFRTCSG